MSNKCPNKNLPEYKEMAAVLGDDMATSAWFNNDGYPVWQVAGGKDSTLFHTLLEHLKVKDEYTAIRIMAAMHTKLYDSNKGKFKLNEQGQPSADRLIAFVEFRTNALIRQKELALYKKHGLIDVNDDTKIKKWSQTTANYKKVIALINKITNNSSETARLHNVSENGRAYYSIRLESKQAFTTSDGEVTAYFDSKSGEITFTDKGLNTETVVHEFAHPLVEAIEKNNPELFKNLIADINKDKEVPEVKAIIEHVNENYSEASTSTKNKELLAYALSEYGKGNINPATGLNTKNAIARFFEWVNDLVKDLISDLNLGKPLFVDQIHPNTKYNQLADILTVYSELGTIDLGTSGVTANKRDLSPKALTSEEKKAKIKAKIKARKSKGMPPAHKLLNTAPTEFIDIKDESKHMASLLPKEIATKLTPGYIKVLQGGKAVVGMFEDGIIHLSAKGPKGTAYHEGYHAVHRTLLDSKAQNEILEEAQSRYASPTEKELFDIELRLGVANEEAFKIYYEEQLADDFADFMDEPKSSTVLGKILEFFSTVRSWIKNVFSNNSKIDQLFNNIKTKKYTKVTPNIQRGVAYRVHEVFNVHEVNKITRELTSIAFQNVSTLEDLKTTPINLATIEETILTNFEEAEESGNEELLDNLSALFDENAEGIDVFWLREIDNYLRNNLGLKATNNMRKSVKSLEKITEENTDESNIEALEKMNFLKSSYNVSGKENATAAVKFMVAMTPEVNLIDQNKEASLDNIETKISNLTGLPILTDFGILYNDVENSLAGIVSITKNGEVQDSLITMLNKLKSQAKYKPELFILANKIEEASEEIRTQFFGAFSKQKGSFLHHQVRGKAESGTLTSIISASNFNSKSVIIRDSWVTQFNKAFGTIEKKSLVYNQEAIDRFFAKRQQLVINTAEEVQKIEANEKTKLTSSKTEFEKLLKSMGVDISPHTLNYIIENSIDKDSDLSYDIEYAQVFEQLLYDFTLATNDLKGRKGTVYGKNNQIQDNTTFFKNTLAEAEAYFKKIPGENSFLGPDGNAIYSFQHNDLTSKAVSQFKQGDLSYLERLQKSAYSKNSVWINELLDPNNGHVAREDFTLHMYGNLKDEATAGDTGKKASDLKPMETYMDNVNKTLEGYFIGLAESDKSRQTYFKGPKFRSAGLAENSANKAVYIHKEGTKILKGYLADELSRMRIAHAVTTGTEQSDPVPEHKWVLWYHYYPVTPGEGTLGENLDKIPGNAFQSYLFPSIVLEDLGLVDADGAVLPLSESNFDNNPILDKYIKSAFYSLVKEEMEKASELGILNKEVTSEGQTSFSPRLISKKVIEDPKRNYKQGDKVDTLQIMSDYVLNSIIGNVEQTKMFNGDPAAYKVKGVGTKPWKDLNIFADFKKRIPAIFASGQDFRIFSRKDGTPVVRSSYSSATVENVTVASSFFGKYDEDGNRVFNEDSIAEISKTTGVTKEKAKELFSAYLNINQTDAQAWITLDAYKERMNGLGKWTPKHQDAYEKLNSGQNVDPLGLQLFAQPLKTVHAELVPTENNEMIMHYNKQSEAILLPFMQNSGLGNLLAAMERDGLDHVIVLDGKKSGAIGLVDIVDNQGNIIPSKDIKLNPTNLSYNNLFLQQDLSSKGIKDDTLVGSQGTKVVLSVVSLEAEYFEEKSGKEVVALFHETLGRLSDKGLIELDTSVGYNSEKREFEKYDNGRSKLHKLIQKEFEGEISENHYEALEENIALDALPIKNKIMNKLMALTTKKTVKLKQPGGALIQLSNLGFIASEQKLSDKVKNGIIWFKDPSEELKPMHIKEGEVKPAQILIPHTKLIAMLSADKNFLSTIKSKHGVTNFKDLTHTQLMEIIPSEILEGMSYRIPNQGPSSNDAFEIVGVLPPEMGDTMVAFSDITMKTGSDFDIDKAYVILPNFYFDAEVGKIKKVPYDINNLDKARPASLQNLRLDLMRQMLMHPDAYNAVMAPLDTPWLEDYAKELFPERSNLMNLEYFTGRYQLETKATFDGAKSLVGSVSNHSSHHSLALADNLYFTDYFLGKGQTNGARETLISNSLDENGEAIATTLGAFMNAIVDAAKDPFIARANINHYTAGTAFTLARAGVDRKWLVAFIGQPIIKDIVEAQNVQEGRFGEAVYDAKLGKRLSAIETVLAKYGLLGVSEKAFRGTEQYPTLRSTQDSAIETKLSKLETELITPNDKFQLQVLKQFLEWQSKSSELNDLIKVSKVDVEGATRTLMTAQLSVNLLDKVLRTKAIGNADSMLGIYLEENGDLNIPKGKTAKMIGRYFNNSVLAAIERFSPFFIAGSNASQSAVTKIAKRAGYTELITNEQVEKLVIDISNEVYTLAAADTRAFNISPEKLHTILYGKNKMSPGSNAVLSIAQRVQAAKGTELGSNLLIDALQFKAGREGAPDKLLLPNTETVKDTKEALAQAWEEILNVDYELGQDLIYYAFHTTGFSAAVGSFAEHVPNKWLKDNNFHEDIAKKNIEYQDEFALDSKLDVITKNLFKNNQIVPVVTKKAIKTLKHTTKTDLVVNVSDGFAISANDSLNYVIGEGPNGKVFKKYVKRTVNDIDPTTLEIVSTDYLLYQLAGYSENGDALYFRVNSLGVSGFGNNVKEYVGDGITSIFDKNNVSLPTDLQNVNEIFSQRSNLVDKSYEQLDKPNIDSEMEIQERLQFCIMK